MLAFCASTFECHLSASLGIIMEKEKQFSANK